MLLPQFFDNPFRIQLSFHQIIERMEADALSGKGSCDKQLLEEIKAHPELRDGITDISQIRDNEKLIARLLQELFPPALTTNEIKAVTIPYQGLIFNYTERFRDILKAAGLSFEINIRDFNDHEFYIASCCLILNEIYGTKLDFSQPLFYDIPTATGILKHYRILYNGDFLEIEPTERAAKLSREDIKLLVDNYEDLDLWKEKFPQGSWILKGFGLLTLFDATVENALAELKTDFLTNNVGLGMQETIDLAFRSICKIPDLRVGFTSFDKAEGKFNNRILGQEVQSFLLFNKAESKCNEILTKASYHNLINEHAYYVISDLEDYAANDRGNSVTVQLLSQNVRSLILAPLIKDGNLLGILELVSPRANDLNSVNAHKLEVVMPFLVDTIDRKIADFQNRIQAVIQRYYTSMHPSVNWKFRREAKNYIHNNNLGLAYTLKEISFKNVYPLYGEVDIKNSSITRNLSIKSDLKNQISHLVDLLKQLDSAKAISNARQSLSDLNEFINDLSSGIKADTEQNIQHYLEFYVYPLLKEVRVTASLTAEIDNYYSHVDPLAGDFYANRRAYEKTLSLVNEKLTGILDERQIEIQKYFPHYYERFKTDGVEHNLYIGSTISPENSFEAADLERLRLWQLLVTAEMEIQQYRLKDILPYHLGVTSLILIFSSTIAIRFRMDEKHFDVDGAYNVRYEVIKKRIDKAYIKNTNERITAEGTITIVYSKVEEAEEYGRYIQTLQSEGILTDKVEHFDIEDLQGVSGLRALRVGVDYDATVFLSGDFSYENIYNKLPSIVGSV